MSNKEFEAAIGAAMQKAKAYLLSKFQISSQDIDDITQDSAIKAFRSLTSFQGKSSFDTWFISICRSRTLEFFRNNKRSARLLNIPVQEIASPEAENLGSLNREERLVLIASLIDKLGPKHREIIKIALSNSLSSSEISNLLKIPINSVRTRLFYAKQKLQKLIKIHAHKSNIQYSKNR